MQHKGRGKKKVAREYSSESLMLRSVTGIVLIALGLLGLLSMMAGLRGSAFEMVRAVMRGLGGVLCLGIPVFLIWGGVLLCFSARQSMPLRGIILMFILYLSILAIFNLLSSVGADSFMAHVGQYNRNRLSPEPESFLSMLEGSYQLCDKYNTFGGALGMLLGWVLWTYVGTTGSMVVLVLLCIGCVMLFSRFDLIQIGREFKRRTDERFLARQQQRLLQEQEASRQQAMQIAGAAGLAQPSYLRKGKKGKQQDAVQMEAQAPAWGQGGMAFPTQGPVMPVGMMPVPYQAMQGMVQNGFSETVPDFGQPAVRMGNPGQAALYDEIVVTPSNETPPWKKSPEKTKAKAASGSVGRSVVQAEMVFTPSEVGEQAVVGGKTGKDRASQKVTRRMEEILRRKAELEQSFSPGLAPVAADSQDEGGTFESSSPAPQMPSPVVDKQAAYRRPVGSTGQGAIQQPTMSGRRLDEPDLQLPDTKATQQAAAQKKAASPYAFPPVELLNQSQRRQVDTRAQDTENAARLESTLESFGIEARVQRVTHGPAVTRFELGLVSSGINVKRITSIADNIALELAANGGVRIEVPIPGTNLFGVEIPNKEIVSVSLSEVLMSPEMSAAKSPLTVALGRDIAGRPILCDLAKMPHLLIAGQTGSGKSVCINTIINSLLFRASPQEVRMIMIDPKVVELQSYNVVPHLLIPVISDPHKAAGALAWAVAEMLDRYHKMQSKNVRELSAYNAKLGPDEEKLPRIVIIIDELADLMLNCKKEVEESIIRIAQLARAAGMHMVVATQRPTVDVITGLIKANIPSRIAFAVSSSIDSRTILDANGAEKLLGRGDMFYFPTGESTPTRVQGCFLSDGEIERVVEYIKTHAHVEFDPNILESIEAAENPISGLDDMGDGGVDDRLQEAIEMVISDGQASISMLQRRMKIGYARAGRLIDDMAVRGIVSKSTGSKPREVLISWEEYERMKGTLLK
mgnify:CR=1 FL=1